jgi:hypothetical protein
MASIADSIQNLDASNWAAAYDVTDAQAQEQTEKWWKKAFTDAKAELEVMAKNSTSAAYRDKDLKLPFGEEVARFSAREYFWLQDNYGVGFDEDTDFLLCYQRLRGQQFLAKPSRDVFN